MPRKNEIIIGEKHNKLTVIDDLGNRKVGTSGNYRFVKVKCECGNEKELLYNDVKSGHTKSCGCQNISKIKERMTTHNNSTTRLYSIWKDMRRRCNNPTRRNYKNYGGRGIKVCDEWEDFAVFKEWSMSHGYNDALSIERINVDGNYEPSNCEWIPRSKQNENRRTTLRFKAISPNGESFISNNIREFAKLHELDRNEISKCLKNIRDEYKGWTFNLI
jgi:hypothetical protein